VKKRLLPNIDEETGHVRPSLAVDRFSSNVAACGRAWRESPRPVKVVVWALTWVVVGSIMWMGAKIGVLPNSEEARTLFHGLAGWLS
jgi:hypothetical protein